MDLLSHITSLPTRTEMLVESPRTAAVKKCVLDILEAAKDPNNRETLQRFSQQLFALLQSPLQLQSSATMAKRRELMWTKYINLRESVLPGLWKSLLVEMKCNDITREPLFMELVNESVFEELTKVMYTPVEEQRNTPADTNFSKDEQNILRYACGYVAMKLHRRYLKQHGIKAATFVECLDHMEVEGPTSSLLAYTREWVDQTNRGGLFDISDAGYFLFVSIEVAMRDKLSNPFQCTIYGGTHQQQIPVVYDFSNTGSGFRAPKAYNCSDVCMLQYFFKKGVQCLSPIALHV